MRIQSSRFALFLGLFSLPIALFGQGPPAISGMDSHAFGTTISADTMRSNLNRPEMHKVLACRVYSQAGGVVPKARVEVTNNAGSPFQTDMTDKEGDFQFDFNLYDEDYAKNFVATIKVMRKGYEVGHRAVFMDQKINQTSFAINLRPNGSDEPNQLSPAELIEGLAARLEHLRPGDGLSPKQQKDYDKGIQEFQNGKHLESAIIDLHNAAVANPNCLKCRTMLGVAELKWGDWDGARLEFGESVNSLIKNQKLGSAEPLLAYGTIVSWNHEPAKASAYLLDALTYSPQDPLVLQEMGRTQCQEMNWYSADQTLKKALDAGAGPEARLLRAEALLWAGTPQEASDELNKYMDGRPFKSMPPAAQTLWANIQEKFKDVHAFEVATSEAKSRGEVPLDYIHNPPTKELQDFVPATDQAQMGAILAAVGKNVAVLFAGLPNICAVEKVHQERLDNKGKELVSQNNKYRYLALIPDHPWGPSVDEYRADSVGKGGGQLDLSDDSMLTEGFVSAPLVFHPAYQAGGTFILLGSQKVKGRKAFVIAYAQIPEKTSLNGTFTYGRTTKMTYTQGLAWIDGENYQIVRITSDLLRPLPEVRLQKETTDISFSEAQFKQVTQKFWLPEKVAVTLDWNGRSYRNNHAYSDFLVSNVEETQKIGKPKEGLKTVEDSSERRNGSDQAPGNPSPSSVPEAN